MPASFPPIARADARVLILGTMPGAESLRTEQYYAHPRNAFWPIMATLLDFDRELPYAKRVRRLIENQVAVWDVLRHCEREGSLDQHIENEVPNDFGQFFDRHSSVHFVFFNGGKAEHWFRKYAATPTALRLKRLSSTSPAMAQMNFTQKLRAWRVVSRALRTPENTPNPATLPFSANVRQTASTRRLSQY